MISRALFSAGGPRASEGATGVGSPTSGQSFRAADALRLRKGNFHRARSPALGSAEPSEPGSSGARPPSRECSFLPRSGGRSWLGEVGGRGLIRDPAPGKAAPPLSLSASAPRIFPSLWRRWMGRSVTLQRRWRQLLLPSPRGCPGGHCRQPRPLRSLRLARKPPTHTALGKGAGVRSAPLPTPHPTPDSSGQ